MGLALLTFEVGGKHSAAILAGALTLRVTAFVLLSPWAGILADRVDRRGLMAAADPGRMAVVGLMPWVNEVWQIYALMFLLNALTAFFTPTYQAALPQVMKQNRQALIADRTPEALQGRVYGAHFAWSHLWWVLAYPLAGWLGTRFAGESFLFGGFLALSLLLGVEVFSKPWKRPK